jgi:phosphate transport system protein
MAKHLVHEIEALKKLLLGLGAKAEENLRRAVRAIESVDANLAREVIRLDHEIDEAEVHVEEEGLKILALHQPVAIDLRFLVAVLKINSELERIGDLASNMAERAIFLSGISLPEVKLNFSEMADKVQKMLRESLDALVSFNADLARSVCEQDDEVDNWNREMYEKMKVAIREDPDHLDAFIHYLSTSRQLERVADHATNIAEDVIYMVEGDIIRHHLAERP